MIIVSKAAHTAFELASLVLAIAVICLAGVMVS